MSAITASMVKELRERTGLGMMECKKVLVETEGDIEKAIDQMRASGQAKAAKKAGRIAAEGIVVAKVDEVDSYGVMVEVNSETDFVARDENFHQFVNQVLEQAFTLKECDVDELLAQGLEEQRQALIQKIGENISLRRVTALSAENGVIEQYIHSNARIGVIVAISGADRALAKDLAMHIAAVNPAYTQSSDVPENILAREKEIYMARAKESGKPEEIVVKMIEGNVRKYFAEVCLMEQPFVKDPSIKIGDMLQKAGVQLIGFTRYEVGEGIQREETDFAAEVMAQLSSNK